jgi:hypothetical protein
MAELQIFTDVTLDTGDEPKRRAFIDYVRDNDGNPIEDEDGKRTLEPVDPEKAEELLGKKPEILLHTSANWKAGNNTGSLGPFTPTGGINSYKPDPSLSPDMLG